MQALPLNPGSAGKSSFCILNSWCCCITFAAAAFRRAPAMQGITWRCSQQTLDVSLPHRTHHESNIQGKQHIVRKLARATQERSLLSIEGDFTMTTATDQKILSREAQ
jgi:hypothetical protein